MISQYYLGDAINVVRLGLDEVDRRHVRDGIAVRMQQPEPGFGGTWREARLAWRVCRLPARPNRHAHMQRHGVLAQLADAEQGRNDVAAERVKDQYLPHLRAAFRVAAGAACAAERRAGRFRRVVCVVAVPGPRLVEVQHVQDGVCEAVTNPIQGMSVHGRGLAKGAWLAVRTNLAIPQ